MVQKLSLGELFENQDFLNLLNEYAVTALRGRSNNDQGIDEEGIGPRVSCLLNRVYNYGTEVSGIPAEEISVAIQNYFNANSSIRGD